MGAHDANLQVAWLREERYLLQQGSSVDGDEFRRDGLFGRLSSAATTSFLPVFMDCWYREEGAESPQSVLYYVPRGASSGREGEPPGGGAIGGMRIISRPFDSSGSAVDHKRLRAELLAGVESGQRSNQGREKDERNFQKERERREWRAADGAAATVAVVTTFVPLEDHESWREGRAPEGCTRVVEVNPQGGTLVLFDSVTVPHEVTAVLAAAAPLEASDEPSGSVVRRARFSDLPSTAQSDRIALAGWFHESQQPFPSDLGDA